ncbi:MAG: DivIVA domain-containing protein [Candidatus Krumholzibacteria bacterium]
MRLTPLDIRKQEFRRVMRGLDTDEVYAFLSTIADEYEAVLNDNKALRERVLELDDKVQEYRNMEKTLRDTLLTAERVTVEAKDNARREANLIVKEAELEAEKGARDIKAAAIRLRQEILSLRRQRDAYLTRMRMMVESHQKYLKTAELDFTEEDQELEKTRKTDVAETPRETPPRSAIARPVEATAVPSERLVPAPRPVEAVPDTPPMPAVPDTSERPAPDREAPAAIGLPTSTAVLADDNSSRLNNILDRLVRSRRSKTTVVDQGTARPEFEEIPAPPSAPPTAAENVAPPPASPAPAWQPEPASAEGPRPVPAQDDSSQKDVLEPAAVPTQGSEWSLERLKQDILSRSRKKDETS